MSSYSHLLPALASAPARRLLARIPAAAAVLLMAACGTVSAPGGLDGPLTLAGQGSFFVGGRELKSGTLSAGREGAWTIFRFGPAYPQAFPGMKYPLEAQAELWKQMVPDLSRALPDPNPTVPALSQLAGRTGGAVLLAHSQSGPYPLQAAALDRRGIAGIVSIEPVACPSATADMTPYKGLPILVLWGDYVNDSPFWAPRVKACGDFVRAASAAGAKAQMVMLADEGMPGQSHMLMQDRNSLQVAQWLGRWIAGHAAP